MHNLEQLLLERIATSLKRAAIKTPSQWACEYRVMGGELPGRWSFERYPWLREMHDSKAEYNVGMKCAQVGFTETMLNISFHTIDILRRDCLYVLPSKTPDASDFSSARFDAALELSPYLAKLFSDTKNVGHKRAGSANLYIRGAQSRSGLKSIPVSVLILDEVAEMPPENISLAFMRSSGQEERLSWMISTPTLPEHGIDMYYRRTTCEEFFFKCPSCSKMINLTFPESFEVCGETPTDPDIIKSRLKCKECDVTLKHEEKRFFLKDGIYIPGKPNSTWRGFSINQLYSTKVKPADIAAAYLSGLTNPADETEFYNSRLGITHVVEGAQITDEDINSCIASYKISDPIQPKLCTMGIDVGKWIHYEIVQWHFVPSSDPHITSMPKLVRAGKVRHFEQLDQLIIENYVTAFVIDAHPERRKAFDLCNRFYGMGKMCIYGSGIQGKLIREDKNSIEPIIQVDRTSWLDLSLGRFRIKNITLPVDIPLEYRMHLKAPARIYSKDANGNPVGSYLTKDSAEDHFAHARNYSEIALGFALQSGEIKELKW